MHITVSMQTNIAPSLVGRRTKTVGSRRARRAARPLVLCHRLPAHEPQPLQRKAVNTAGHECRQHALCRPYRRTGHSGWTKPEGLDETRRSQSLNFAMPLTNRKSSHGRKLQHTRLFSLL